MKEVTVKHNTCEKKKDLENIKRVVIKFERRLSIEVRGQEKLNMTEKRDITGKVYNKNII